MDSSASAAPPVLDATATAQALPYPALVAELAHLLADDTVRVSPRLVQPLPGGGSLFVMPAHDGQIAVCKLITFTPANAGTTRPTLQGDVLVFDLASGARRLILHGPTVTARRTAAVSLLAAQALAPNTHGPLLILGAGVQGQAHLHAFSQGLPLRELWLASRSEASAHALAEQARQLGLRVRPVSDPQAALADCPLVVTCTPAQAVVLRGSARTDAFIAAVGAFTPQMLELDALLCRQCAAQGEVVLDSADARHEAGDLLQAGLNTQGFATLAERLRHGGPGAGPVLFKSCGWAGWDLAAARLACASSA